MLGQFLLICCCIAIGSYMIIHEEQIAQFERDVFKAIKRLFVKEKIVVLPRESEQSKQARFESGKAAGDELYMGGAEK